MLEVISESSCVVDCLFGLDLFFGRPDDDSVESKHVAIRILFVINCCI